MVNIGQKTSENLKKTPAKSTHPLREADGVTLANEIVRVGKDDTSLSLVVHYLSPYLSHQT